MEASVLLRPLLELMEAWRAEASHQLERYQDEERARGIEVMARDLEAALEELSNLTLSYDEAAEVGAWSRGTIANKVSAGELENVGTRSDPRVRLRDLTLEGSKILPALGPDSAA